MQEELSAEKEEWYKVDHPNHDEETTRIPQTLSDGVAEDGDVPTLSKDARGEDTEYQEDGTRSGPPANKVMSTTRCETYSFPWIFKDCQERTGHNRSVVLYQLLNLSSRQSDFKVLNC